MLVRRISALQLQYIRSDGVKTDAIIAMNSVYHSMKRSYRPNGKRPVNGSERSNAGANQSRPMTLLSVIVVNNCRECLRLSDKVNCTGFMEYKSKALSAARTDQDVVEGTACLVATRRGLRVFMRRRVVTICLHTSVLSQLYLRNKSYITSFVAMTRKLRSQYKTSPCIQSKVSLGLCMDYTKEEYIIICLIQNFDSDNTDFFPRSGFRY